MNDTELDDMLNQWEAPEVPAHLRESIELPRPHRKWRFSWPSWHLSKGLLAGALAGAAICFIGAAAAFPETFSFGKPSAAASPTWFVVSNVVVYDKDGSSHPDATISSYSYKGTEFVLYEQHPQNPTQEFFKSLHNSAHQLFLRYLPGLAIPESADHDAWFAAYVKGGCVDDGEKLIGHDTILGHSVNEMQQVFPRGWRWTVWRAPDLGCFALRFTDESSRGDGSFQMQKERTAVHIVKRQRRPEGGWTNTSS